MLLKGGQEYICSCFLKRNVFLKNFNMHVAFENEEQFHSEYRQQLRLKGCTTDGQYKQVLSEVSREIERRNALHQLSLERMQYFKNAYVPMHPAIWSLNDTSFNLDFFKIVEAARSKSAEELLSTISDCDGTITEMEVYQFPVLTSDMCRLLVEEIDNFEKSPGFKTRPNTMNNYGINMDEMGLSQDFILPFVKDYVLPVCANLFPLWGGATIDSFKAFSVKYEMDKDLKLSEHYDNAEVTINLSLSDGYVGGELDFGGISGEHVEGQTNRLEMAHKKGYGVLHCGRRMHLAQPITQGSRTNLIIWMRSSMIRNQLCPMCNETPSLIKVPAAGEGFVPDSSWSGNCTCV